MARPARKGGLPNALFLLGDATSIPDDLAGCFDEIRMTLPWGALLRATIAPADGFAASIGRLLKRGGTIRILLSLVERDAPTMGLEQLAGDDAEMIAARWSSVGFRRREVRRATAGDVASLGSSWAKRLGVPRRRTAWVIVLGNRRGGHERLGQDTRPVHPAIDTRSPPSMNTHDGDVTHDLEALAPLPALHPGTPGASHSGRLQCGRRGRRVRAGKRPRRCRRWAAARRV